MPDEEKLKEYLHWEMFYRNQKRRVGLHKEAQLPTAHLNSDYRLQVQDSSEKGGQSVEILKWDLLMLLISVLA